MTIYRDFRPTEDATVVRKLYAAGAIILGKLTDRGCVGRASPADPSAGEPMECRALVRCFLEWFRRGNGGRTLLRIARVRYRRVHPFPSAANGVTGVKPTWGRVSRYGVFELAATLDHIGPMARSAADCGAMLGVIAGNEPGRSHCGTGPSAELSCRHDARIARSTRRRRSRLEHHACRQRHGRCGGRGTRDGE